MAQGEEEEKTTEIELQYDALDWTLVKPKRSVTQNFLFAVVGGIVVSSLVMVGDQWRHLSPISDMEPAIQPLQPSASADDVFVSPSSLFTAANNHESFLWFLWKLMLQVLTLLFKY